MRTRKYEAASMDGFSPGNFGIHEAEVIDGARVGSRLITVLQDVTQAQADQTAASLQAQYDRLMQPE